MSRVPFPKPETALTADAVDSATLALARLLGQAAAREWCADEDQHSENEDGDHATEEQEE